MTIAANSQALASDILDLVHLVRKTSDETVNNNDTLQNDDELLFAVSANEVWVAKFILRVLQGNSATPDFKFAIVVPAACAVISCGWTGDVTNVNKVVTDAEIVSGTGHTTLQVFQNTTILLEITVLIQNGANAGNVQLQWAQAVATGVDTIVEDGSCIIAHRLA